MPLGTRLRPAALALAALVLTTLALPARARAQITLTFSASPPTLVASGGTAGQPPPSVLSGPTTWSLLGVWALHPRITAHVTQAVPAGVQLEVRMTAPTGATSSGWVTLGTTPANVVTNLPLVSISGLGVSYRLTATAAAGVLALTSRTVVFTLVWT